MCHTSCDLEEAGKLTDYLGTIKTWMDKNQGQVVTILLTNGDRVDVNMFKSSFETSGMATYAYSPPKKLAMNEWPTLQSLINDRKRAVVFLGMFQAPFDISSDSQNQTTLRIRIRHLTFLTNLVTFSKLHST